MCMRERGGQREKANVLAVERTCLAGPRQDSWRTGSSTESSAGCERLIDPAGAFCRLLTLTQEIQTRLITTSSQVTAA